MKICIVLIYKEPTDSRETGVGIDQLKKFSDVLENDVGLNKKRHDEQISNNVSPIPISRYFGPK